MPKPIPQMELSTGYENWNPRDDNEPQQDGVHMQFEFGDMRKMGEHRLSASFYQNWTFAGQRNGGSALGAYRFGGKAAFHLQDKWDKFGISVFGGPSLGRGPNHFSLDGGAGVEFLTMTNRRAGEDDPKHFVGPQAQVLYGTDGSRTFTLGIKAMLDRE